MSSPESEARNGRRVVIPAECSTHADRAAVLFDLLGEWLE
jgi:hypothetical protein